MNGDSSYKYDRLAEKLIHLSFHILSHCMVYIHLAQLLPRQVTFYIYSNLDLLIVTILKAPSCSNLNGYIRYHAFKVLSLLSAPLNTVAYLQLDNMSALAGPKKHVHHTVYMIQLLESADVSLFESWGVAFAAWLLLAGFVVFPGTFTNIKGIDLSNQAVTGAERWLFTKIQNLPLLGVAAVCSGLGALGMIIFWIRWRHNHVLVADKVFLVRLMCYI